MAAGEVSPPTVDKAKLGRLQRADMLKLMEERRAELQAQKQRAPEHFGVLARLLQHVDAELLQIFKNQQSPVHSVQLQQAQSRDSLLRSRAELLMHLTRQGLCPKEADRSARQIEIEVQKQKYPR